MDMKFELLTIPVSDIDRTKQFYESLGFRLDVNYVGEDGYRLVHFTPPGSEASILFGSGVTSSEPGSVQGMHLVVSDIDAAREELVAKGVDVSEIFHDAGGVFHHLDREKLLPGADPGHASYGSFATFSDPDGNGWVLQEVRQRLPGR